MDTTQGKNAKRSPRADLGQRSVLIGFRHLLAAAIALQIALAAAADYTFRLKYRESGATVHVTVPREGVEITFKNEPDYVDDRPVYGVFRTGTEQDQFTGFAWDKKGNKLYIDTNRNLDLTDDTEGGLTPSSARHGYRQVYKQIQLQAVRDDVTLTYLADLTCYSYSSRTSFTAMVQSNWYGRIQLHGREWDLSIADNMDAEIGAGDLLNLRPVDGPDGAVLKAGNAYQHTPGPDMFVQGHAYRVSYAFEPGDTETPELVVTFCDQELPMGNVSITGTQTRRLVLNGPRTVALDSPAGAAAVPAGSYHSNVLYVGGDDGKTLFKTTVRELVVPADGTAELKAGGPLCNSAKVQKQGSVLKLDYQLTGVGGELYEGVLTDRSQPPTFSVFRGGHKLFSGSFQYG